VALVALLSAGAFADYRLFYCRIADITQSDCCCKKVPASSTDSRTAIDEADCCDVRAVHVDRAPSTTQRSTDSVLLVAPAVTSFDVVSINQPALRVAHPRATRAPGVGPPLILLKQSFLV